MLQMQGRMVEVHVVVLALDPMEEVAEEHLQLLEDTMQAFEGLLRDRES
jgi:hypothetical protein